MQDVIEMLAVSLKRKDALMVAIGFILFPFTLMFRFRDAVRESEYANKEKPLYATVWIGNLKRADARQAKSLTR
jgi:hypothetical protein